MNGKKEKEDKRQCTLVGKKHRSKREEDNKKESYF
jgi:hypothetical protein